MRKLGLLLCCVALMVDCGGSPSSPSSRSTNSGTTGTSGTGGTASKGTLTAIVDGVSYTGIINAASLTNGNLNIASNNTALTLSVNLATSNAAVGTTNISASSPTTMQVMTTNGSNVTGVWFASAIGGSGTLTITSLSSSGVAGTFSFVGTPLATSGVVTPTVNKTVTSGVFSATF